ncbi:MAG: inositol monophosphatase family protein [Planctomycetota bacterium]
MNADIPYAQFLTVCQQAARLGGAVLMDWRDRFTAREKSPRDLVTEADLASQLAIQKLLSEEFPEHRFVGEEECPADSGLQSHQNFSSAYRWIVDPLDGTANYVHGMPNWAVSIALAHHDQILVGTVFDPILNECFSAVRGGGAWLNDRPLQTSRCRVLSQAMIAASFAASVPRGSPEITRFVEMLHECQSIRRLGSCALNLCYVAAGRLDGYWATAVKSWDAAAGILIVEESGGVVTNLRGGPLDLERPELLASATPELHDCARHVLARAESSS